MNARADYLRAAADIAETKHERHAPAMLADDSVLTEQERLGSALSSRQLRDKKQRKSIGLARQE